MPVANIPGPWSHEAYVAHNDRLAKSLAGQPQGGGTTAQALFDATREHLRRARRAQFAHPHAVHALHDALASLLEAVEAA